MPTRDNPGSNREGEIILCPVPSSKSFGVIVSERGFRRRANAIRAVRDSGPRSCIPVDLPFLGR